MFEKITLLLIGWESEFGRGERERHSLSAALAAPSHLQPSSGQATALLSIHYRG